MLRRGRSPSSQRSLARPWNTGDRNRGIDAFLTTGNDRNVAAAWRHQRENRWDPRAHSRDISADVRAETEGAFQAFRDAASEIGDPLVRNRGTFGGSLASHSLG
jgi:hypothetical protein